MTGDVIACCYKVTRGTKVTRVGLLIFDVVTFVKVSYTFPLTRDARFMYVRFSRSNRARGEVLRRSHKWKRLWTGSVQLK